MKVSVHTEDVYLALEQVMDPEIPVLNVVELGMITGVEVSGGVICVKMIPTFAACPAVQYIQNNIREQLQLALDMPVEVKIDPTVNWSSNRMSEAAKQKLQAFGIAAPRKLQGEGYRELLLATPCPHCGSTDTYLRSPDRKSVV